MEAQYLCIYCETMCSLLFLVWALLYYTHLRPEAANWQWQHTGIKVLEDFILRNDKSYFTVQPGTHSQPFQRLHFHPTTVLFFSFHKGFKSHRQWPPQVDISAPGHSGQWAVPLTSRPLQNLKSRVKYVPQHSGDPPKTSAWPPEPQSDTADKISKKNSGIW